MMRHGVRGPLPEAYQDYPAIIHDSGQELLLMVEDMLDLARADADR
jgi:cell cycle sensor histidine kinase DivJ